MSAAHAPEVDHDQRPPTRPLSRGASPPGLDAVLADGARRVVGLLSSVTGTARAVAHEVPRYVLRRAVEAALATLDVTRLVLTHVDLDALAAGIDVDAVVARADLDSAVARVDVDAVVARVDVDAVLDAIDLDAVMTRVDLDALLARIDLDAVVARVDLNQVAARLDLDAVAARIDLEALVQRIDPDALVARVDLDALLARLDLVTLTRSVLEAVDLPVILRESSGAVSSQAARVVRTEGMHADDSVSRWVDRVLRRGHPGTVVTP